MDPPADFSVSLSGGGFSIPDNREDGPNTLSVPGFNAPGNFSLQLFYKANDDPWSFVNPSTSIPGSRPNQAIGPYYPPTYDFADYRNTGVPSDNGTLPADSGYGSHNPQYSVASNSSIHEDEGTLDSQLPEQFMLLGREGARYHSQSSGQADLRHQCPDCSLALRTKSEYNKHLQRHRKPYPCPYPNCSRREGFSTKNDLSRHKKTVHKEHDGNGPIYVCRDGTCAEKNKLWPRADNFRQHLSRVHGKELRADDDLSPYLYQPSPSREVLKGVGSSVAQLDSNTHPRQIHEQSDLFANLNTGRGDSPLSHQAIQTDRDVLANLSWTGTLEGLCVPPQSTRKSNDSSSTGPSGLAQPSLSRPTGDIITIDDDAEDEQPLPITDDDAMTEPPQGDLGPYSSMDVPAEHETGHEMDLCATIDLTSESTGSPEAEKRTTGSTKSGRSADDSLTVDVAEAPTAPPSSEQPKDEIMKYLASVPRDWLENVLKNGNSKDKKSEPDVLKQESKPQNQCPECQKLFNRPCELKKHSKRHEKPYGCTFRDCHKVFGSKNDWKRHESSQHWQLETWNCEEAGCSRVCHRREAFKNHLQRDHSLDHPTSVEEKLERCRMGRHCDPRFWCGFCVKVVEIQESGANMWMKRCDHIDNHLMGKEGLAKKRSSEWEYLEDQQPKEAPAQPSRDETARSTSTNAGIRRRRSSPDRSPQPLKKNKVTPAYMWRCHLCCGSSNLLKTTPHCPECGHPWCTACDVHAFELGNDDDEDEGAAVAEDDDESNDDDEDDDGERLTQVSSRHGLRTQ